jgi:hypothetical protein
MLLEMKAKVEGMRTLAVKLALHADLAAANLPAQGIPRLERVEDKPWGMREFALLDADGNLLKFGRVR